MNYRKLAIVTLLVAASFFTVAGKCKPKKKQLECCLKEWSAANCIQCRSIGGTYWTECSDNPSCKEGERQCGSKDC